MHIGAVSSVVAGTVGLCTDIQPLTAQSRIIGRGFHGVNRIDIFQRPAGHNDQGRVDLNGVCTFLAVDPLLICFNSQNGTLLGLIQREMNVKGAQARSILHAGNRNPVNLLLIAVQERDRAVFIQDSGKTAAFQQKVKPVTFLRLIDNDLFLNVISEIGVLQINTREHILVNQGGLEFLRNHVIDVPVILIL